MAALASIPVSVRLSFYYFAYFTVGGTHLPFFPVFLAGRGIGPAEMGFLLGTAAWVRILAGPAVGWLADRTGRRKSLMVVLSLGTLATFALFQFAHSFWVLLAVGLLFGSCWAPILPLGDSIALTQCHKYRIDFGRVRLWGSLSFIGTAAFGGWLLDGLSSEAVFWMLLGALVIQLIATLPLPDERPPPATTSASRRGPIGRLVREPLFMLFLFGSGVAQASHSVMYAFGTLHWRAQGLGEKVIGLLWAEGVIAEIIVFALGARILRRVRPAQLLTLGAAAGIVRWTGTAYATEVWQLVLLQALHGGTFGCAYLGAMYFLQRGIAPSIAASAQALYSAVATGLALGLGLMSAGPLYAGLGAQAFLVMTLLSAFGAVLGLLLSRRWGERVLG